MVLSAYAARSHGKSQAMFSYLQMGSGLATRSVAQKTAELPISHLRRHLQVTINGSDAQHKLSSVQG